MVPGVGLEPTHGCPYQILSLARLPISPPRRQKSSDYSGTRNVVNSHPTYLAKRVHPVERRVERNGLARGRPSIDGNDGPTGIRRSVRGQKRHDIRDMLRFSGRQPWID